MGHINRDVERASRRATGLQLSYFVAAFLPGAIFALPWSLVGLLATWLASVELTWLQCYVCSWAICTALFWADFRDEL